MSGSNLKIKVEKDLWDTKEIKIEPPDDYFDTSKLTDNNVYIKQEYDNFTCEESIAPKQTSIKLLKDFVQRGVKIEDDGKVVANETIQKQRRSQKCDECGQKFLSERLFLAHMQWHASIVEVKIENAAEQREIRGELHNCINEAFTSKEFVATAIYNKITDAGVVLKEECGEADFLANPNRVSQKHNAALQIQYVQCNDDLTEKINALKQGQISYLKLDSANIDYYECDICHDSFPLLIMLESHKRIHTFFEIESQVEALDFSRKKQSDDVTKGVTKVVQKKPEVPPKKPHRKRREYQICECAETCGTNQKRFPREASPSHECRHCGKKFASRKLVLRHVKSHNVKCEICRKTMSGDLMESHECDTQYTYVDELRKRKEKLHECNTCGKLFVAVARLKRHLRLKHSSV